MEGFRPDDRFPTAAALMRYRWKVGRAAEAAQAAGGDTGTYGIVAGGAVVGVWDEFAPYGTLSE